MQFVVDVNISKNKKLLEDHTYLEDSEKLIDGEVSNKKIIDYARKHNYGFYTQDKEAAVDAVKIGIPVLYMNDVLGFDTIIDWFSNKK